MDPDIERRLAAFLLGENRPACDHSPISGMHQSATDTICRIQPLHERCMKERKPFLTTEHPLVFSLWNTSCERHLAQMLASGVGWGMDVSVPLANAFSKLRSDQSSTASVRTCHQCRPGTNTWKYSHPYTKQDCHQVPLALQLPGQ